MVAFIPPLNHLMPLHVYHLICSMVAFLPPLMPIILRMKATMALSLLIKALDPHRLGDQGAIFDGQMMVPIGVDR